MKSFAALIIALCYMMLGANAQFQFFEQMFNGGHQQQHQGPPKDGPSDSDWYRAQVDNGITWPKHTSSPNTSESQLTMLPAHCSKYLCPDTLACVSFPHHCPCPYPANEDKVELQDGKAICISKGGFKAGEAARKVELARKGLI